MTKSSTPPQRQPLGHNDKRALATVQESLVKSVPPTGTVDAAAVQAALGLRSLYLAQRLLIALSGPNRKLDSPEDFVAAAQDVMGGAASAKLDFLFRLHDEDGDGSISREEMERLLHISVAENALKLSDAEVDGLVSDLMRAGDQNDDDRIGFAEFVQMVMANPAIAARLCDYGVSLLMPGKRARAQQALPDAGPLGWVRNHLALTGWLVVFAAANVLLFGEAFLRYRDAGANVYIQLARGCGACLNFNGALIALPMLRGTLTLVRRSFLGHLVPVDDAVSSHALIGEVLFAQSLLHTGAHTMNLWTQRIDPWTRANVTGVALLLVMLMMWVGSRNFVRRSGRFELFYFTHLGYFAVVALCFLHGPRFWMWASVPWSWLLVESALRSRRRSTDCRILDAKTLASGVVRLEVERKFGFSYRPGDYVFLCLPAVARHEWHPFTLTSAPEDAEHLTVHIRSVGNWTHSVHDRLPALREGNHEVLARIDGPYGTASRHILEAPHAVVIAGGIGVTPFASILQSLSLRQQDPSAPDSPLKKLHFVWLNRDQYSFEWFRDLLAELEERDQGKLLDIHAFMTSGRADMAGGLLELARLASAASAKGDIVTGLKSQTGMGAPDFDRLLETFCATPDLPPPQVFFCGPASLERVVARAPSASAYASAPSISEMTAELKRPQPPTNGTKLSDRAGTSALALADAGPPR